MPNLKSYSINLVTLIIAGLIFAGPSWGQAPADLEPAAIEEQAEPVTPIDYSRFGRTLTVATRPVTTLDSQSANDFSSQLVIHNIQEGLFTFNQQLGLVPVLASQPPLFEDNLTYIIALRKGIYFHDGSELDADAVAFTVNRLLAPETKSPLRSYFARQLKSAEVLDRYTVKINLARPYIDIGALFSRPQLYPLSPKTVKKYGADYGKVIAVGTGPFVFSEWKRDEKILLKRFGRYWQNEDGSRRDPLEQPEKANNTPRTTPTENETPLIQPTLPYLNVLQFKFHPSEELALIDLESRRLSAMGKISPLTAGQVRSRYVRILHQPGLLLNQIYLNIQQKPFDDKMIRMALAYGIDRESIAREVFGKYATPATTCFPDWHWAHAQEYQGPGFHPMIARQLLYQAGYNETNPLRFELLCTDKPLFTAQAEATVRQWKGLGVEASVKAVPKEELLARLYGKQGYARDFSAVLEDWQGGISPDTFSYDLYGSASPYNKVLYNNQTLDLLFYHARSSHRLEEKAIFYQQAERLITSDISTIYLSFRHNIWAYNRYVEGMEQDWRGFVSFKDVWLP